MNVQFTYMKAFSEPKDVENVEIWLFDITFDRIYHRMNETFFVTNSFIWRRWSPYNNNVFSFENWNWAAVASVRCFSGQISIWSQINVKNIFTFRLFTNYKWLVEGSNWVKSNFEMTLKLELNILDTFMLQLKIYISF